MLRIITVPILAILVEIKLYVVFAGIFSDTLSQRLVDFFVGNYFGAKELDKLCGYVSFQML